MQDELQNLQGTWNVVSLEIDGSALGPGSFAGAQITIQGDAFTSAGMGAIYTGTVELDAGPSPRSFRMKFSEGPEKGNTNHGIYDLDGDTWKICLAMNGGPAPTAFTTARGSGHALEVLVRKAGAG